MLSLLEPGKFIDILIPVEKKNVIIIILAKKKKWFCL